jgi:hypothetical protein
MARKKKTRRKAAKPTTTEPQTMAADNGVSTESVSGYWKEVLKSNPRLIAERSNDELYEIYLKDHPDEKEVPQGVKNGLSNVKSIMRKASKGRRKRGRPSKADLAAAAAQTMVRPARAPSRSLETLEDRIDDCLSLAKSLGQPALESVVAALKKARNQVIIQMGG